MVSIATAHPRCLYSPFSFGYLNYSLSSSSAPSCVVFVVKRARISGAGGGFVSPVRVPGRVCGTSPVGFYGQYWNSLRWFYGFSRRCKAEDSELEEEILEFMRNSGVSEFPSKEQLIDAGRIDLMRAISERGGWLSMGWDLDDDDDSGFRWDANIGDLEYRMSEDCGNGRTADSVEESYGLDCDEIGSSGVSSNSSNSVSSSGRSLETTDEDDSGFEGILRRLEKERDINFGLGLRGKGDSYSLRDNDGEDDWHERLADPKRSSRANASNDDSVHSFSRSRSVSNFDGLRNSLEPAWKTWSMQREASSNKEFEESSKESSDRREGTGYNHIQNRLNSLELELSSVFGSLRSKSDAILLQEGHQKSSAELRKLSDAWEFQENEIMNAQDKLRSIRAKLAVLEGKMALAIIDAQKVVDAKQRRIDDACKALRLLRTILIVWTSPATEVLLVGSYDGWATKRKMEKSSAGIFSLYLKLYPGRYEIKFIVDGEWKIDPLRPIVNDSGHENNLLIIS